MGQAQPRARRKQSVTRAWTDIRGQRTRYAAQAVIFAQGDSAASVFYIEQGSVRLSVLSGGGKEAIISMLTAGHFFGESCLAGQTHRLASAITMSAAAIVRVEQDEMVHRLRTRPAFAKNFLAHLLTRNIQIQDDLLDQLFHFTEKRLARTLLLIARDGDGEGPRMSQERLAEMVGTTRSRVNFFMNKFRKLGFIDYGHNGRVTIHDALLTVILAPETARGSDLRERRRIRAS